MSNTPRWVRGLTDADLNRRFGASTVARGRQIAKLGRVGDLTRIDGGFSAPVRDNGMRVFVARVLDDETTACSCPDAVDCRHVVALCLTLADAPDEGASSKWRKSLGRLLPHGDGLARTASTPLALQVEQGATGLALRPVQLSARGGWLKAGATWSDVQRAAGQFLPTHRQAVLGLVEARKGAGNGYLPDLLTFDALRPDAWHTLASAHAVGVELVAGDDAAGRPLPTIELSPEVATPVILITRADDGVLVTPALDLGDEEMALPAKSIQGNPGHGVAIERDGKLVLAGFNRPLDEQEHAVFATGPVTVPTRDLSLFASGFLPHLRRRVEVRIAADAPVPVPARALLVCRVEFGDGTASLRWAFRYGLGEQTHDLSLRPEPQEPPVRDPEAERTLADAVPRGPWRSERPDGRAELRPAFLSGRPLIEFVTETLPRLRALPDVVVDLNREAPEFSRAEDPVVELSVSDPAKGDWFDLTVTVRVGDDEVPFDQLFAALSAGDDHVILDDGTWFPLDAPELNHLRTIIDEARLLLDGDDDTFQLRPEHAGLWDELTRLGVVTHQSEQWQASVAALLDHDELPEIPVPTGLRAELRGYQVTGFRWLAFLWRTRLGGILADEMGLGKTVQALALAQAAHEAGELDRPLLVVAPTSVIGTWAAEAAKFTPELKVTTITETNSRRGEPLADAVGDAQIVLTSYTLLRLEAEEYQQLEWSMVLLDEAQFIKNHTAKAHLAVRRLHARLKVALTGTPLENNLMDLWSLLAITAPGLFPDARVFTKAFRTPIEAGNAEALARLHRRTRPLLLRRTKSLVATELPEKMEQLVPVELSPAHRTLYDRHLARERQKVLGLVGNLGAHRITILRSLTRLRQLSLAPSLIEDGYPEDSAKIDTLVDLLDEVIAEGHRALVFSQFTSYLALVKKRLASEGIGYEYLDGSTRDRAERIESFRGGDAPVFLISLKAGGFGLTLTEADYVFILDPWWNPAAENQAIDRTHRIGQDKPVNVYRLVATDTIEEKVLALQESKRDLFDAVVGQAATVNAPLSADDILGLLGD